MERIKEILNCGAKNSTIARALKEAGYFYTVSGWDVVRKGIYLHWKNEDRDYKEYAEVAGLEHESSAVLGDFVYPQDVKAGDVPALKWLYLS